MDYDEYVKANAKLSTVFENAGADYGFTDVNAEFTAFTEFKVRWQKSYTWADFRVSDYLMDAPEEVLSTLAHSLFRKMVNEPSNDITPLTEWVTRKQFIKDNRDSYIARHETYRPHMSNSTIKSSFKRLIEKGLVPKTLTDVRLIWEEEATEKMGHCSALMKVVTLNNRLIGAPNAVIDYCLYKELTHILVGYSCENADLKTLEAEKLWEEYPDKEEAYKWLEARHYYV